MNGYWAVDTLHLRSGADTAGRGHAASIAFLLAIVRIAAEFWIGCAAIFLIAALTLVRLSVQPMPVPRMPSDAAAERPQYAVPRHVASECTSSPA